MHRSVSLTAAAALVVGTMALGPAAAHDLSQWTGSITLEEHSVQDFGDAGNATIDQTLTFSSSVNLADETVTTMTFQGRYIQFTPASVPGVTCSRTTSLVGGGTVPARVTITPNDETSYQIRTEALAAVDNMTTTITFAGPSTCADVITSVGEHATGAMTFNYTPPEPPGLDTLALAGTATLGALQQGISVGPVEARWSFSKENDPPVGVDDTAETDAGTGVDIAALANDTDPDQDALDLVSVVDPPRGTALISRGEGPPIIRYIPDAGFVGTDTFEYQLTDSHGATDTAVITVTVNGVSGTLVLAQTLPDGSTQSFVYTGAGGPQPVTLTGTASTTLTLVPGSYTITQDQVPGWSLNALSCDRGQFVPDLNRASIFVTIEQDVTTTCTFTNGQASDLVVDVSFDYEGPSLLDRKVVALTGMTQVRLRGGGVSRVAKVCVFDRWHALLDRRVNAGLVTLGPITFGTVLGGLGANPGGYDPFPVAPWRGNGVVRSGNFDPDSSATCYSGAFDDGTLITSTAGQDLNTGPATWYVQAPPGSSRLARIGTSVEVHVTTVTGEDLVCGAADGLEETERVRRSTPRRIRTVDLDADAVCPFTLR